MMMQWYSDHPVDGIEVARSISVGLPPDATTPNGEQQPNQPKKEEPEVGHVVPEADREVQKEPLSVARISSIPAFDIYE